MFIIKGAAIAIPQFSGAAKQKTLFTNIELTVGYGFKKTLQKRLLRTVVVIN